MDFLWGTGTCLGSSTCCSHCFASPKLYIPKVVKQMCRIVGHSRSALSGTSVEHKSDKLHSIHDLVNFGETCCWAWVRMQQECKRHQSDCRGEVVEAETDSSLGTLGTYTVLTGHCYPGGSTMSPGATSARSRSSCVQMMPCILQHFLQVVA